MAKMMKETEIMAKVWKREEKVTKYKPFPINVLKNQILNTDGMLTFSSLQANKWYSC